MISIVLTGPQGSPLVRADNPGLDDSIPSGLGWPAEHAFLLAVAELDSITWVSEVKRIRGKKESLSSAGLHALRDESTRTIEPARTLATETLAVERSTSAEINLIWETAPPRMPIPLPAA